MKSASKNISRSLRSQEARGRDSGIDNSRSRLARGQGSGIFPGERGTERPPGKIAESSAAHAADTLESMVR